MTPRFPAQRRAAEEFARVVDGPVSADLAEQYAGLARTVTLLRERPQPVPRPEFVSDLRDRLMVAADEALAPVAGAVTADDRTRTTAHRRRVSWRQRHLSAGLAALVMVGGTAGLAAAAQGSLPGDTLYPLKRGMERVEVSMSTNDAAKGKELLNQASTRLSEVQALMQKDSDSPASVTLITDTLQDFRSSADKGSELLFRTYQGNSNDSDIADVRAFTTGTMETLQTLADQSPPNATDDLSKAGETVADIDQQARVLCVTCSDADPVSLPSNLVNLASAQALETLVSLPAQQAHQAAQLAQKAEDQAASSGTSTGQPTTSPTATPSGSSAGGNDGGGLAGDLPTISKHPIKDLVDGLTAKAPIVNDLGNALNGLTDPLGTAVDGVTKSLNGLLGGPSSSASPQADN